MKVMVSEATNEQLDWLVAKCEGSTDEQLAKWFESAQEFGEWKFTTDWAQGGPIILREKIATGLVPQIAGAIDEWYALKYRDVENCREARRSHGPTLLIAAMRCYVASLLGAEVEIPDELRSLK